MVVLVGAGLLVRTLENLRSIDPGFDTSNVLNFSVDATSTGYKGEQLGQFVPRAARSLQRNPGRAIRQLFRFALAKRRLDVDGFHLHGKPDEKDSDADLCPSARTSFRR